MCQAAPKNALQEAHGHSAYVVTQELHLAACSTSCMLAVATECCRFRVSSVLCSDPSWEPKPRLLAVHSSREKCILSLHIITPFSFFAVPKDPRTPRIQQTSASIQQAYTHTLTHTPFIKSSRPSTMSCPMTATEDTPFVTSSSATM